MSMREIKFRTWDGTRIIPKSEVGKTWFLDFCGNVGYFLQGNSPFQHFAPDSIILMQFTGLHDKNGKEIYEGDVLRSSENDEVWRVDGFVPLHRHDYVTNIGYFSGDKYHLRENPAGRYSQSDNLNDWLSWPEMYEVIGNIYENPDLITDNKPSV